MKFDPQLTVLVSSCDKYMDVLKIFSVLFKKFWPGCPFEVVLMTESDFPEAKTMGFNRVFAYGKNLCWREMLKRSLAQIKSRHVLMLLDDYLIAGPVDTALILDLCATATRHHIGYLPMIPSEGRPIFKADERLALYEKGKAYCIGTQAGIWDHAFLDFLADQDYSCIWEFERVGAFTVSRSDFVIAGTRQCSFPFEDSIHKGHWEWAAIRLCQRNHVPLDLSHRRPISNWEMAKDNLKGAILQWNPTLVVKVQNFFHFGATHTK